MYPDDAQYIRLANGEIVISCSGYNAGTLTKVISGDEASRFVTAMNELEHTKKCMIRKHLSGEQTDE